MSNKEDPRVVLVKQLLADGLDAYLKVADEGLFQDGSPVVKTARQLLEDQDRLRTHPEDDSQDPAEEER